MNNLNQILSIELGESFQHFSLDSDEKDLFSPLAKINLLVGANNSGKSRFMRMLASESDFSIQTNSWKSDIQNIRDCLEGWKSLFEKHHFENTNAMVSLSQVKNLLNLPKSTKFGRDTFSDYREIFDLGLNINNTISINHANKPKRQMIAEEFQHFAKIGKSMVEQTHDLSETDFPNSVYIPILRGLKPLDATLKDFYLERTKNDYFSGNPDRVPEIFTGISLFEEVRDHLLGDLQKRKRILEYQEFISKKFFNSETITLIPNLEGKILIVKIGDEKERPIYDLGDGIQSAIILSFLPFMREEPTFFYIEEPEMYLHPGLQRKILNFFDSLNHHIFFCTTHSNHFLDLTIDIPDVSIFNFRKSLSKVKNNDEQIPNFVLEAVDNGNNSSLELLGVRKSSVFLVNATIWVEGITDRWYFRAMLDSYIDHLSKSENLTLNIEEDVHYSFVEYGGSNITHWSFLDNEEHPIEVERLCSKALLIVDQDGDSKLERKEKLRKLLGERLIILPAREVENLLPYKLIKAIVLEYENSPDRQLRTMQYSWYQKKPLGKYIEDKMLEGNVSRDGGYAANSGTIKAKVNFCKKALPKINYSDLPQSTKDVVVKIYEFIKSQNSG